MANDGDPPTPPPPPGAPSTLWREDKSSEVLTTSDVGRAPIVFPDIQVKFDGLNMFEWSKLVQLTLDGRQLGHHLTDPPLTSTDPSYKARKSEDSLMHQWILVSMSPGMMMDFLNVEELWDDIQKYSEKQNHDWQIYELNARASQTQEGSDSVMT